MASDVDICNMALAHFGQDASIDSIDPPDGSAEAEHCARFYPTAREELLADFDWTWARAYARMAQLENDRPDWQFRYALPRDCLMPRRVLPDGFGDAEIDGQDYERAGASIYTDAPAAVLRYTARVVDPTLFSPGFSTSLSWLLASYVSGPIMKDPTGRTQASLLKRAQLETARAQAADANSSRARIAYRPTAARVR